MRVYIGTISHHECKYICLWKDYYSYYLLGVFGETGRFGRWIAGMTSCFYLVLLWLIVGEDRLYLHSRSARSGKRRIRTSEHTSIALSKLCIFPSTNWRARATCLGARKRIGGRSMMIMINVFTLRYQGSPSRFPKQWHSHDAHICPPSSIETIKELEYKQVCKPQRENQQMQKKLGAAVKMPISRLLFIGNCNGWSTTLGRSNVHFSRNKNLNARLL